jgi:hypothetical protein
MNGKLDEVLAQFRTDGLANGRGIRVAEHADARGAATMTSARVSPLSSATCSRLASAVKNAAGRPYRLVDTPWRIGALRACSRLCVLANFPAVEIGKHFIADILEDKSLAAVAHHNPVALTLILSIAMLQTDSPTVGRLMWLPVLPLPAPA